MIYHLIIGEGITPFKFGMTPAEVMAVYGIPTNRNIGSDYELMEYHHGEVELHFYGKNTLRLAHIDFYLKEDLYYNNEQIRGRTKDDLLNGLFKDIQNWEITDDEGDYEDYLYREKWLELVFVDDKLNSVSLGKPDEKPSSLFGKLWVWLKGE